MAITRSPLGKIVATPGALAAFHQTMQNPHDFLARHAARDWGDLAPADVAANNLAVEDDSRILSAYTLSDGTHIWIITEADRSTTTLLLPGEY